MTKSYTTPKLFVTDIYLRNGELTADAVEEDLVLGQRHQTRFNMNLGGKYAEAVMDYIRKLGEL